MERGGTAPGRGRDGAAVDAAGQGATRPQATNDGLAARWLTAAVGLPVVGAALWAGGLWWTALITVVVGGAFYEWVTMLQGKGIRVKADSAWVPWTVLAASLWVYGAGEGEGPRLLWGAAALATAYVVVRETASSGGRGKRCGWLIVGLVAVVMGLGHLVLLRSLPNGLLWTVVAVGGTWSTDTAAFFVGRALRGPLLAPRVSPRKTVSGAVGGLVGAALWTALTGPAWLGLPLGWAIPLGVLIGCFSQAGDLMESRFKRHMGVKDSGRLLPGHGGLLDRFDSLVLTAPFVYYFQHFFL